MRHKAKKVIMLFLTITFAWIVIGVTIYNGYLTRVVHGRMTTKHGNLLTTENGFVFDTGANASFISKKKTGFSLFLFPTIVSDTYNFRKILPVCYAHRLQINDAVAFERFAFVAAPSTASGHEKYDAVIGMNLISKTNLYFSFVENTIDVLPLDSLFDVPPKAIVFEYKGTTKPTLSLKIDGLVIDDILIDTGFDNDLALDKDAITLIKTASNHSSNLITNKTIFASKKQIHYLIKNISIESRYYKDVAVIQSTRRLIGTRFFKRYNHMFWDSKNHKIYLWL